MKFDRRKLLLSSAALGGSATFGFMLSPLRSNEYDPPPWPEQEKFEKDQASRARMIYIKNENPLGPSPLIKDEIKRWAHDVEFGKYNVCDFYLDQLKNKIAELENLEVSQIFLASGSRGVIANMLSKLRTRGFRRLVMPLPDYSDVADYATQLEYKTVRVPFSNENLEHPLKQLSRYDTSETVIYFSNPHLPYGSTIELERLTAFLRGIKKALVVVDEAYIEFLAEDFRNNSAKNLLSRFPNLVVVRTFSKIYGLAGMRIGYGLTPPKKSSDFFLNMKYQRILNPLAASCAFLSLSDFNHLRQTRTLISQASSSLASHAEKAALKIQLKTSFTNFYTVRVPYSYKNRHLHSARARGEVWAKFKTWFWTVEPLQEFQTYVSIQNEPLTLKTFDRLSQVLVESGFIT